MDSEERLDAYPGHPFDTENQMANTKQLQHTLVQNGINKQQCTGKQVSGHR